jgi:hypothetical protein
MAFNGYIDYDSSSYYGRGVAQNTGIIATDTGISVSAGNMNISSSAINGPNGPYVINTGAVGAASGTTNYTYHTPDWQNKRMDVRDNGKIPVDIWAMMYNNGVIDD